MTHEINSILFYLNLAFSTSTFAADPQRAYPYFPPSVRFLPFRWSFHGPAVVKLAGLQDREREKIREKERGKGKRSRGGIFDRWLPEWGFETSSPPLVREMVVARNRQSRGTLRHCLLIVTAGWISRVLDRRRDILIAANVATLFRRERAITVPLWRRSKSNKAFRSPN